MKGSGRDTWFIYRALSGRWMSVPPIFEPYIRPAIFDTWREAVNHMLANDPRRGS